MSASFPNAKKTFSAVVNGVTKLVAALFNSPYEEIEAEQTFIGPTGGGALAYTTSLTDALINYRRGCACEYKSASDLYVRAGEIVCVDSSGNRRFRRNPSDTTVDWTNIDTGSEASSTLYYIYAVADASATTFTVKISTNSSAPSGCTYYKLLGTFYNDGSSNIQQVANLNNTFGYGNRVALAEDTVYLAATDGIVRTWNDTANGETVYIYADGNNPPTTKRGGNGSSSFDGGCSVEVKKGEYFKIELGSGYSTIWWMPTQ